MKWQEQEKQLRQMFIAALGDMKPGDWLFMAVKAEMQRRGYWKNKARGRAFSKGHDPRRQV